MVYRNCKPTCVLIMYDSHSFAIFVRVRSNAVLSEIRSRFEMQVADEQKSNSVLFVLHRLAIIGC